ncbi:hypothetical protein Fcan01_13700, partial [Folsomia candida]
IPSIRLRIDDLFSLVKEWKDLKDLAVAMSIFETPEIVNAFKQTEFLNQIQNLTLHLASVNNIRNIERNNNVDQAALDAVVLAASRLQSFKLSDFEGHAFLTSVAPLLQNLSVEKENFDELSQTGSTVAKNLKIKL